MPIISVRHNKKKLMNEKRKKKKKQTKIKRIKWDGIYSKRVRPK